MNEQMIEELAVRFTYAAVHFLWVGSLLAALVSAADRVFVRSAAARHGLHLAGALAMAVALPVCFAFQNGEHPAEIAEVAPPAIAATTHVIAVESEAPVANELSRQISELLQRDFPATTLETDHAVGPRPEPADLAPQELDADTTRVAQAKAATLASGSSQMNIGRSQYFRSVTCFL